LLDEAEVVLAKGYWDEKFPALRWQGSGQVTSVSISLVARDAGDSVT
jgi:hypothetical protein